MDSEEVAAILEAEKKGHEKINAKQQLLEGNLFRIYSGHELMKKEFPPKEWLIDKLIFKGDSVLLVGDAKAGKSLLIQDAICAMSSGGIFLKKYQCCEPQKICYVQLEGELSDTQSRFKRLSEETPINLDNFFCYYAQPQQLQDTKEAWKFMEDIHFACSNPNVLIIDCLYQAFKGSLKDDEVIRQFIGNVRLIKAFFQCTIIILHHMRKASLNPITGKPDEANDDSTFGSAFLKAWPDHLLLLKHQKNSDVRKLTCTTQRSGEIEAEINLVLCQPDPLFWKTLDEIPKGIVYEKVKDSFVSFLNTTNGNSAHAKDIQEKCSIPKTTFYDVEKMLRAENKIWKEGSGKSTIYRSFSFKSC